MTEIVLVGRRHSSKDKLEDPEMYEANVRKVWQTYAEAQTIGEQGGHVISTDEKTGIQALERLHRTKDTKPGLTERLEFEYKRHGTLCLIASFDVVTGNVIAPTIGLTRTEEDFVAHITRTVQDGRSRSRCDVDLRRRPAQYPPV